MTVNVHYSIATPEQVTADLGATLARIRLSQNLSQLDLAARAGITEKTLRNLEKGNGASLNTFIRLLQALGLGNHLENLLPDPGIQPVVQVERHGKVRQRASSPAKGQSKPWTWDEEEAP